MKLRPPSVPLITVDPYFSVWSPADRLTDCDPTHWTGKPNPIRGTLTVDGAAYRFLGAGGAPALAQKSLDVSALSTTAVFAGAGVELTAAFTAQFLPDDLAAFTRPVGMLTLSCRALDGRAHEVTARIAVSEEICLDRAGEDEVTTETVEHGGLTSMKMGNVAQPVLGRDGDDVRIDWGYFYLTSASERAGAYQDGTMWVYTDVDVGESGTLVTFAYDDVESILYFGERLRSFWNRRGGSILTEIETVFAGADALAARCRAFSDKLFADAVRAGGEKYAELLALAYRQVCAGHKLVYDGEGRLLYISKECFSNGCAATVDVSYPSAPLFLLYNPELVEGMLRPIFKFARSGAWENDFAPHDAGRYPFVTGQVYAHMRPDRQMPVEECGNMLIMTAAVAVAEGTPVFAEEYMDLLEEWETYLERYGRDPENQLCTDDFAGHMAHNCNLSVKAVMGITALSVLYRMLDRVDEADEKLALAREMAADVLARAANGDGSLRLAYDREGSYSMKYNMVWDRLWNTGVFDPAAVRSEVRSYFGRFNRYGMPLDGRAAYTKSDWLVWTATMCRTRAEFEAFVAPLWLAYHESASRVPMTDWYDTETAAQCGFQHRTVQGGLFVRLLEASGKMRLN